LASTGSGRASWATGLYYSNYYSLWGFRGTTPNYSSYMDLGTLAPATTPNWYDAYSPTTLSQFAAFGDATYALTDALKVDVGARVNHYDYRFSSCLSGWDRPTEPLRPRVPVSSRYRRPVSTQNSIFPTRSARI